MLKLAIATLALAFLLASAPAQNPGGPTKVTGKPTKLPDGLEYWDIKEGTGPAAKKSDKVKVHYTGWLTDGKKSTARWTATIRLSLRLAPARSSRDGTRASPG